MKSIAEMNRFIKYTHVWYEESFAAKFDILTKMSSKRSFLKNVLTFAEIFRKSLHSKIIFKNCNFYFTLMNKFRKRTLLKLTQLHHPIYRFLNLSEILKASQVDADQVVIISIFSRTKLCFTKLPRKTVSN